MPSPTQITVPQLSRLVGLPNAPALVDVRTPDEFRADPGVIPLARHLDPDAIAHWAEPYANRSVVVYCQRGHKHSEGAAAWLRAAGIDAQVLEGGFEEWLRAGEPRLDTTILPARDPSGRTTWVTRARPKIVRIACPWLVRRFVDPAARFLYVPPPAVKATVERFGATAFDIDGAQWGDRGERCTFDVMLDEFGLNTTALSRLALIVRGADTGKLDLTPQSAGLLAASLGLSRMHRDDLTQLEAALPLYDAFYRWCRDAVDETHG